MTDQPETFYQRLTVAQHAPAMRALLVEFQELDPYLWAGMPAELRQRLDAILEATTTA